MAGLIPSSQGKGAGGQRAGGVSREEEIAGTFANATLRMNTLPTPALPSQNWTNAGPPSLIVNSNE